MFGLLGILGNWVQSQSAVTEALVSVQYIMTETNFGWLIQSVHHWSASMMVQMMILSLIMKGSSWQQLRRLCPGFMYWENTAI